MSAEDRIKLIEGSVRCFRHSWLSFIPFVGIVFAAVCVLDRWRIRRLARTDWNPAGHLLAWSGWITRLAMLLAIVEWVALMAYLVANA